MNPLEQVAVFMAELLEDFFNRLINEDPLPISDQQTIRQALGLATAAAVLLAVGWLLRRSKSMLLTIVAVVVQIIGATMAMAALVRPFLQDWDTLYTASGLLVAVCVLIVLALLGKRRKR